MQINGNTLSTAFIPRSNEAREAVRPPVIIDAEPRPRSARPLLPAVNEASAYQAALTLEEQKQERFVRVFADSSDSDAPPLFDPEALPRGVQAYQQIADLDDTAATQRLFDEIV